MRGICRMGAWACGEKVWKTLMSIDISRNKRLRSERTLICNGCCGALRGTGPRTTGTEARFFLVRGPVLRDRLLILSILSILAILLQTRERLRSYGPFLLVAPTCYRHSGPLDLVPSVGGGRSARVCPSPAFNCLNQDGQDGQDLQDGGARACGEKVWKTLMSIEFSRNERLRSVRTLMCPAAAGCVRGTGPRPTGGPRPL